MRHHRSQTSLKVVDVAAQIPRQQTPELTMVEVEERIAHIRQLLAGQKVRGPEDERDDADDTLLRYNLRLLQQLRAEMVNN